MDIVRILLAFIPRPVLVASSTGLDAATLWRGAAGWPMGMLRGRGRRIVDVKFFPGAGRVATAGADGVAVIWGVWSGRALLELRGAHSPDAKLFEMQVFPGGERVVTLGSDGAAVVWSSETGEALQRLVSPGSGAPRAVRVFPDGERLAIGASYVSDDPAIVWRVGGAAAAEMLHVLVRPGGANSLLELSPCGAKIVTGGSGFASIFVWDAATGRLEREFEGRAGWNSGVGISAQGAIIATSLYSRLFIWNGTTGLLSQELAFRSGVVAFALLPGDDARLAVFTREAASIYDARSGARLWNLEGAGGDGGADPRRLAVSEDGSVLVACGGRPGLWGGQRTEIWDVGSGRKLHAIPDAVRGRSAAPLEGAAPLPCSVAVERAGTFAGWFPQ